MRPECSRISFENIARLSPLSVRASSVQRESSGGGVMLGSVALELYAAHLCSLAAVDISKSSCMCSELRARTRRLLAWSKASSRAHPRRARDGACRVSPASSVHAILRLVRRTAGRFGYGRPKPPHVQATRTRHPLAYPPLVAAGVVHRTTGGYWCRRPDLNWRHRAYEARALTG